MVDDFHENWLIRPLTPLVMEDSNIEKFEVPVNFIVVFTIEEVCLIHQKVIISSSVNI